MRKLLVILLFIIVCAIPAKVGAVPELPASASNFVVPVSIIFVQPGRDDAHEDSIYYEYGFENEDDRWNGWTTEDLTNPGFMWHTSEQHAFEDGSSWWCANPGLGADGGYDNHWLQYLITPSIDLSNVDDAQLDFMALWAMEAAGNDMPQDYDGWDGFNVWVSLDGGEEWWVIEPDAPDYYYSSLYSFGEEWNMGPNIAGWGATSDGWIEVSFDLGDFVGNDDVRIRWAFCSDPADATPDRDAYISVLVDNLTITGDGEEIWSNNGDEQGDMEFDTGPVAGDFWELSDESSHGGDFSAHCPIRANLQDALITPPLEIPSDPWYTYFDFWIHMDARNWDSDGDGNLDDYFTIDYSLDGVEWEQILYDYKRDQWPDGWMYYGPDTSFNAVEEWKIALNLTGFGGETIWLRWKVKTDNVMGNNEGTGFWIDDFRLNITSRLARDARVDWVHVPYPTALAFDTRCVISITNMGISDLLNVKHYWRYNSAREVPIIPFQDIESDATREYSFLINRIPFADRLRITGFLVNVPPDQDNSNDSYTVNDVVVYPESIWVMGYDTRSYQFVYPFDQGDGPAIRFTPEDDGLDEEFDIVALRVIWNGAQAGDAATNMHFFTDDGGEPGDLIYSSEIVVTQADLLPNEHVIDLTAVEELKSLQQDFWIWFEILNGNNEPAMVGGDEMFSEGHYYNYDGNNLSDRNFDLQIHPVLMPAGADWTALVAGRSEIDFEEIAPDFGRTIRLALFNGGTTEVTIESFIIESDEFSALPAEDLPFTLRIGDYTHFFVEFHPAAEGRFSADLIFNPDDNNPTTVELNGVGEIGVSTPEDDTPIPTDYELGNAFPNPFNATAVIPFSLPRAEYVSLEVFDLNGRKVADVVAGHRLAGTHEAVFSGADLATGVYVYQLKAGSFKAINTLVLIK